MHEEMGGVGLHLTGSIRLIEKGDTDWLLEAKQNVALARGAVGMLVVSEASPARPTGAPAGLFSPSYYRQLTVPVGIIDTEADAALPSSDPLLRVQNAASEVRLPRPQRAFFGRVRRAMMEAIQVIGKSQ